MVWQGREHWLPLFDEYGVTAAFEHHWHVMKVTKPLRNNEVSLFFLDLDGWTRLMTAKQVHEGGTVYFGDGGWGAYY